MKKVTKFFDFGTLNLCLGLSIDNIGMKFYSVFQLVGLNRKIKRETFLS